MKKRLSLLLAALMILTMLPISAFAGSKVYVSAPTITDGSTRKLVTVTYEMDPHQELNLGKVHFNLTNAQFAPAEATTSTPANPVYVPNHYEAPVLGGTVLSGGGTPAVAAVQNQIAGGTAVGSLTLKNGLNYIPSRDTFTVEVTTASSAKASSTPLTFTVTLAIDASNSVDGNVLLSVKEEVNEPTGLGDNADKVIAIVNEESRGLSVKAFDPEKMISYDGGSVSKVEIKNFDAFKKTGSGAPTQLMLLLDPDDYYALDKSQTELFLDGIKLQKDAHYRYDSNGYAIVIPRDQIVVGGKVKEKLVFEPVIEKMGSKAGEGTINLEVRTVEFTSSTLVTAAQVNAVYDATVAESVSATIGKVVNYGVTMTVKEKGKKEIPNLWAGEEAVVEVTLKAPKGTFSSRSIEFNLKDASVIGSPKHRKHLKDTNKVSEALKFEVVSAREGNSDVTSGIYRDGKFIVTGVDEDTTEIMFEMRIQTPFDKDGVSTITAVQRAWDEVTADLAKSTLRFTVATETTDMKKGEVKDTKDIVITEAKEGLLRTNQSIVLFFETTRDYIEFEKEAKVEATNGMVLGKVKILKAGSALSNASLPGDSDWAKATKGKKAVPEASREYIALEIPIKKVSKGGAAVIKVTGIQTKVDGSTVDGTYPIHVTLNGYKVTKADYVKVVKEYGFEPIVSKFVIGQTQYDINGKAMTAASAPYVKNGRTMLPIRAVAESLGLNVQWNKDTKTASFTDSTKTAALVLGADTMYVNGTPIKLSSKAEMVNNTIFVELRSLATAFGVQIDWDAAAKTATVSK